MLLLFDIDGTLVVKGAREHALSLLEALDRVHGLPAPDPGTYATAGKTDGQIARELLIAGGVEAAAVDEHVERVREEACRTYARRAPDDLSHAVVPGARAALSALRAAGHRLSLLTGNFEPIARLKLERAGLASYFPDGQGAFGSDHEQRPELPAIARRRAGDVAREDTVVIGDTPLDVACAQADGLRCLAVTTGAYDERALREAGAAEVVPSVADVPGLLG